MTRPRVYLTQPIPDPAFRRLRDLADVVWNADARRIPAPAELAAAVRDADVLFCMLHDTVDAGVIAGGPHLRLIASTAAVPANIDVAAATARRVPVTAVPPPMVAEATADITMALLLAVARRVIEGDRLLRSGAFPGSQSTFLIGGTVHGKTLGIVGLGDIGRAVARRARGFGMSVLYMKRTRLSPAEERELGVEWAALPDLLRTADFVSVHAAQTPETRHLIGAAEIRAMKATAYLINTSRGTLVDEAALAAALREGRIAGAGLDVYEREPRVTPELLDLANVVLLPHLGSADRDTRNAIAEMAVDNVAAWARGERPPNAVNPEVWA
jgi:glyoxylate reductase